MLARNLLTDDAHAAIRDEAEVYASAFRERMHNDVHPDPEDLFRFVYSQPTAALRAQSAQLAVELAGSTDA